jgi:hypothetical protein
MIRSAFRPERGFDERLTFTNDWLFDIEVFRHGPCVALDDVLVRYRRHPRNFTTRADATGISYEEGLMTMSIVMARYPQLHRGARRMSMAILLGQARRRGVQRDWRRARAYAAAALSAGGLTGVLGVASALLRSALRRS